MIFRQGFFAWCPALFDKLRVYLSFLKGVTNEQPREVANMEDSRNKHGKFSWNELLTTDPEGAKEFYGQLFGWTSQEWPMSDFNYSIVKAGDTDVGGIMPIPSHAKGMPPAWGAYVTVDDVDATAGLAEKLGGKVCIPPTDIPTVGRFTVIQDPQGAMLSAITYVKK
jgi:predicted enzyme related to lactoylglutathione lyase